MVLCVFGALLPLILLFLKFAFIISLLFLKMISAALIELFTGPVTIKIVTQIMDRGTFLVTFEQIYFKNLKTEKNK